MKQAVLPASRENDERACRTLTAQCSIARDNTALREELEARVVARTRDLEVANRELEAFSYSVSHDLRAPLRAVEGFARALAEKHAGQLGEEGRRYLGIVRERAARMGELIDDLLQLGRVGRRELAVQHITLGDLVRNCIEELRPQCEGRRVEFSVGALPECHADPLLAKQLFLNLIGNAVKYTGKRAVARIEVGTEQRKDGVAVFVRDNGAGFDMAAAGRLFEPFQRLHSEEEFPGTGVGLAIVRRIAERHGCRVWAEAKPGAGATFYLGMPAH